MCKPFSSGQEPPLYMRKQTGLYGLQRGFEKYISVNCLNHKDFKILFFELKVWNELLFYFIEIFLVLSSLVLSTSLTNFILERFVFYLQFIGIQSAVVLWIDFNINVYQVIMLS